MSMELSEFHTRKEKIDVMLKEQGWEVPNRAKVITEVDTKQSDFRAQNYKGGVLSRVERDKLLDRIATVVADKMLRNKTGNQDSNN